MSDTATKEKRPDDWRYLLEPSDIGSGWNAAREDRDISKDHLYDEWGLRPEMIDLLELDYGYDLSSSELWALADAFDTAPGALLDEVYERAWKSRG